MKPIIATGLLLISMGMFGVAYAEAVFNTPPTGIPSNAPAVSTTNTQDNVQKCTGFAIAACEDLVKDSCEKYYLSVSGDGNHQCAWDDSQSAPMCRAGKTDCSQE